LTVNFTTIGTADLIITAVSGTTFGESFPDDLKFLELNDGTQTLNPIVSGNTITYPNYSSTEQGFEASKVMTIGNHHLMFQFGNDVQYANNVASPAVIMLRGSGGDLDAVDTDITWGIDDRVDTGFTRDGDSTTINVDAAGVYRVMYSIPIEQDTVNSRGVYHANVEVNGGDALACNDALYIRSNGGIFKGALGASCLLDLPLNAAVNINWQRTGDVIKNAIHLDADGVGSTYAAGDHAYFQMYQVPTEHDVIMLKDSPTTGQTIPINTGEIIITMDTTTLNSGTSFSVSGGTGVITVNTAGYYLVTYGVGVDISADKDNVNVDLQIDGTPSNYCSSASYGRTSQSLGLTVNQASCIVHLPNGTEELQLAARTSSPTTTALTIPDQIHFDAQFLGADLTTANVLRVSDTVLNQSMEDSNVVLSWNVEDDEGASYTFTGDVSPDTDLQIDDVGGSGSVSRVNE